jgi:hypothetical protein
VRRELERIEIPDEHDARLRTWEILRAAYAEQELPSRRLPFVRPLLVSVALAAVVAAALTAPGRAVLTEVREAIGVERSEPALVSLPAPGRLLVVAEGGVWIVNRDGAKRRLGAYPYATWSPRGLYVAAVRGQELFALDPKGEVRWSLARRRPLAWPSWAPTGYRIAYKAGSTLRVVAGDGTGDRLLRAAGVVPAELPALAWAPSATRHLLAYADTDGAVVFADVDTGRRLWRSAPGALPQQLSWSPDGRRLLALSHSQGDLRIFDRLGRLLVRLRFRPGPASVAFSSRRDHLFAFARRAQGRSSEVVLLRAERVPGTPRRLFSGTGIFTELAWAPNGNWILLTWPSADQWLFVRPSDRRLTAVSGISRQFGDGRGPFPTLAGWCCR